MAAVLACGPSAVLSHRSAAALWKLLRPMAGPGGTVGSFAERPQARRGLRIHRRAALSPQAVTVRDLIPVTTPSADDRRPPGCRLPQPPTAGSEAGGDRRFALGPLGPAIEPATSSAGSSPSAAATDSDTPGQRQDRALDRRLPLARAASRGRDRQLALSRRQRRLRGRPRARHRPSSPRLRGAPLHRTSDPRGGGGRRGRPRRRAPLSVRLRRAPARGAALEAEVGQGAVEPGGHPPVPVAHQLHRRRARGSAAPGSRRGRSRPRSRGRAP